ncbi:MAG TPA: hypothetical protein VF304_14920 [Casimicrobiaceae bacterium]
MIALLQFLGMAAISLTAIHAQAYEQATHAAITDAAFSISILGDGSRSLVRSLGLDTFAPLGEGTYYFEFISNVQGITAYDRKAQPFEIGIVEKVASSAKSDVLRTWLLYGAIREDDNPNEDPATPQDVETGVRRPLHHFFDPYFNRPLSVDKLDVIEPDPRKSVDWALGVRDSFVNPNLEESPRRNRFTIFDAHEAMFRALTLKSYTNGMLADAAPGASAVVKQALRQKYWTTAFRALGNVLHLNQDMAQPQHTRNEVHSGIKCFQAACPTGHTSVYEKYMNARVLKVGTFNSGAPFKVPVDITPAALPLATSYATPSFSRYQDYWSTAPKDPDVGGKGLADYSNRGFFTAAKNLGESEYPWPSNDVRDYQIRTIVPTRWDGSAVADATPVQAYYGDVRDKLLDIKTVDVPLTTYGLWDQFLLKKSAKPKYSLNRLNYDAMADLLLPRAVAYSAGLINFFFRGVIDIGLPDQGVFAVADHAGDKGFTKIDAKIRNVTPSFADPQKNPQPQNMSSGTLFAVVRYHTDKQYEASLEHVVGAPPCADATLVVNPVKLEASTDCRDGIEQIVVSKPITGFSLASNGETSVEFDFGESPIPFGITDVVLQVVYRGSLGSEADAVAVGTIDVSEPTYFTYQNASDYIHIGEHVYTRGQVDEDSALLAQVQPRSCVDYGQSPPHLADGCLDPFPLDLSVSFTDAKKPIAKVEGLPGRRLVRIAWLTIADEPIDAAKMAARNVKVSVRRHAAEKASLYQDGTCLPLDPFDIPPRHAQMTVSPTGYRLDQLGTLRGVRGWYSTSCVWNGDAAPPGAPDDRNRVMTPLDPKSNEIVPYAVAILPGASLP